MQIFSTPNNPEHVPGYVYNTLNAEHWLGQSAERWQSCTGVRSSNIESLHLRAIKYYFECLDNLPSLYKSFV